MQPKKIRPQCNTSQTPNTRPKLPELVLHWKREQRTTLGSLVLPSKMVMKDLSGNVGLFGVPLIWPPQLFRNSSKKKIGGASMKFSTQMDVMGFGSSRGFPRLIFPRLALLGIMEILLRWSSRLGSPKPKKRFLFLLNTKEVGLRWFLMLMLLPTPPNSNLFLRIPKFHPPFRFSGRCWNWRPGYGQWQTNGYGLSRR